MGVWFIEKKVQMTTVKNEHISKFKTALAKYLSSCTIYIFTNDVDGTNHILVCLRVVLWTFNCNERKTNHILLFKWFDDAKVMEKILSDFRAVFTIRFDSFQFQEWDTLNVQRTTPLLTCTCFAWFIFFFFAIMWWNKWRHKCEHNSKVLGRWCVESQKVFVLFL